MSSTARSVRVDPDSDGGLPSSTTGEEYPPTAAGAEVAPGPAATAPVTTLPADGPAREQFLALFTAVMLPMFLAAVDQTLLATATPRIMAELGALADSAWIAVGYLLAATVMAPIYGRVGDRYGRRPALLGALAVFAAGSLLCGLAGGMPALIAGRVVQGLGGGGLMVLSQALIGELVPPRDRPRYQGYFAIVFTASSVGGPVLGGFVVHHASWRWLFLANLPLCALAAWRVSRLPRAARSSFRDSPIDPWGVLWFVITACSALLWFSLVGHRFALLSAPSAALAATALVAGTVLWRQQQRHANPFLPLDIARLPGVGWVLASVVCFAAAMFALIFLLPIYLQVGHHASASSAGLQMLPLTAGIVLGSWLNGRVTLRRHATGSLPAWGLGAGAVAIAVLAFAPPLLPVTLVAAGVCGIGFGTVMPNAQLTAQMRAGRPRLGASAALLSLTRSSGASLGTAAFGGLVFVLLQVAPAGGAEGHGGAAAATSLAAMEPEALRQAFRTVFAVLAGFVAVGAWAASRMPVVDLRERELERP